MQISKPLKKIQGKEIEAIYKGIDGRFGFKVGQKYNLIIHVAKDLRIKGTFGKTTNDFEYGSLYLFLENFTNIVPIQNYWIFINHHGKVQKKEAFKLDR